MALIKVQDIAYGRLRAPDLDAMEAFLTHFGMVRANRTKSALYMRGTGPSHHLHVTEQGEPAFVGIAWQAASAEDLARVAKAPGASAVAAIAVTRQAINNGAEMLRRKGELYRLKRGPATVQRIGHGVMATPRLRETVQWFRDTLGLIGSDDLYVGSKDNLIGSFNRCDRGEEYVDHHVFFCLAHGKAGLNHLSFEVQDIDDVFAGHHYLKQLGKYEHMWGIGRHLLGSNVYDYWADPWGRVHEHWSDSDRLNARSGTNLMPAEEGLVSQWGEPPPQKLLERVCA